MVKKCLIIEGDNTRNNNNGDLREGFGQLFAKFGCRVQIKMGAGKDSTVDKFRTIVNGKSDLGCEKPFLLIDLDKQENEIQKDLETYKISEHSEFVCYMVQEMEAWFLSQPQLLDNFYGAGISSRLPKKHPKLVNDPVRELENITKQTPKGLYHKIRHGAILLNKLDPTKLINDFPELKRFVENLKK